MTLVWRGLKISLTPQTFVSRLVGEAAILRARNLDHVTKTPLGFGPLNIAL